MAKINDEVGLTAALQDIGQLDGQWSSGNEKDGNGSHEIETVEKRD